MTDIQISLAGQARATKFHHPSVYVKETRRLFSPIYQKFASVLSAVMSTSHHFCLPNWEQAVPWTDQDGWLSRVDSKASRSKSEWHSLLNLGSLLLTLEQRLKAVHCGLRRLQNLQIARHRTQQGREQVVLRYMQQLRIKTFRTGH